ncbi:hypothetical protein WQ57_02570 [Mesobacillus campisalis]|uniref:Uncharacterized protein n=1 Tax=Mesobacillus campisalis TaxID=1408103 RepID=A0A0M2T0S6_9BACI|nr:hypothetical protein WQ57_02570 [Mesobacillus campisalis]
MEGVSAQDEQASSKKVTDGRVSVPEMRGLASKEALIEAVSAQNQQASSEKVTDGGCQCPKCPNQLQKGH